MTKDLKKEIKKWLRDFEHTQPGNVQIDYDTFEGSAYSLLCRCLQEE